MMGGIRRLDFGTLADFIDYASGKSEMERSRRNSRTPDDWDEGWHGTRTWTEALELAPYWREGAEKVQALRLRIGNDALRPATKLRPSPVGPGALMMGDYVMGSPTPWAVRTPSDDVRKGRKIIRIVVNVTASASVSPQTILTRGAAILALVDSLERANRRCEIVCVDRREGYDRTGNADDPTSLEYRITVKNAARRISLPTVAFAIGHPSFLRRICFSANECEPENVRENLNIGGGYGSPGDTTVEPDEIYLGRMHGNDPTWGSPEAASRWVHEQAARQGIKIVEAGR